MSFSNSIPWITADGSGSGRLELQIDWTAGEAVVHLAVPSASQGAPGIAHGGFLAAVADHVMGFAAAQHAGAAVATRQMTVDYLAPTPTSRSIGIRAQPGTVSERLVTVSLEGSVSGRVTFRARGEYAVVSSARRRASPKAADYDGLEERFDPSQVFGWLTAALQESYLPGVVGSPVLLAVEVTDATPRHWAFRATGSSLEVEAGEPAGPDVRYSGTVRSWRELVYRVKTADQLVAAGSATIDDPEVRLPAFLAAVAGQAATS